jgi:hypothetical protein
MDKRSQRIDEQSICHNIFSIACHRATYQRRALEGTVYTFWPPLTRPTWWGERTCEPSSCFPPSPPRSGTTFREANVSCGETNWWRAWEAIGTGVRCRFSPSAARAKKPDETGRNRTEAGSRPEFYAAISGVMRFYGLFYHPQFAIFHPRFRPPAVFPTTRTYALISVNTR